MNNQNVVLVLAVIVIIALVALVAVFWMQMANGPVVIINSPNGQTGNTVNNPNPQPSPASKDDLIRVTSPLPNQVVNSPLTITGQARGNWYFEASFPVKLLDANGNVLAQAPAQAQGNWMTTDYVPFTVTLTFANPAAGTGTLVLEKDNPSGLPQNANELRIPVTFQ